MTRDSRVSRVPVATLRAAPTEESLVGPPSDPKVLFDRPHAGTQGTATGYGETRTGDFIGQRSVRTKADSRAPAGMVQEFTAVNTVVVGQLGQTPTG